MDSGKVTLVMYDTLSKEVSAKTVDHGDDITNLNVVWYEKEVKCNCDWCFDLKRRRDSRSM